MKVENVRVGSPCSEPWEGMKGGDKRRFCEVCRKDVHDLSAMTRREAQRLVDDKGQVCIQYQRAPGGGPRFRPTRRQLVGAFVGSLAMPMAAVASPAVRTEGKGLIEVIWEWFQGPPPAPVEWIEIPDRGMMLILEKPTKELEPEPPEPPVEAPQ